MVQQREGPAENIVWALMFVLEQKYAMCFPKQSSGAAWQRAGTVFLDGMKIGCLVVSRAIERLFMPVCISHIPCFIIHTDQTGQCGTSSRVMILCPVMMTPDQAIHAHCERKGIFYHSVNCMHSSYRYEISLTCSQILSPTGGKKVGVWGIFSINAGIYPLTMHSKSQGILKTTSK